MQRRLFVIGLLGFASGIPLYLTSSTLAIWFGEAGVNLTTIGLFSAAAFPYALKFLWAPLIDRMPIPYLTKKLGRRRSWMLISQIALIIGICGFATFDPGHNLVAAAILTFFVAFAAATQEATMLAYQMECLPQQQYGPGEAISILGYRLGMVVSGAGALYLATLFDWGMVYIFMAAGVSIGLITVLCIKEPKPVLNKRSKEQEQKIVTYLRQHPTFNGRIGNTLAWFYAAVIAPFADFTRRQGWLACLMVLVFYKLGDNLIGTMNNIFYLDLGFSKVEIAHASKLFGMWATILGGLVGGVIIARIGFLRSLLFFGVLHAIANLMYVVMAYAGHDMQMLYVSIALEHVTGGMRTGALLAYQLTLCNVSYAATQLALMTSCVSLGRTVFASTSGWLVEQLGWVDFFLFASAASVPSLMIVLYLMRLTGEKIMPGKQQTQQA